jgi:antitoxin component YwqK of YwqJK toxin-antitoxin module
MQIKNGLPEGTYIIYFENRKPQEIRSYREGKLHGLWRKYDISGQLISEAEYKNGKKHGTWRIWDELGTQRYEINYNDGNKTGFWRMWDEKGILIDEKKY